MSLFELRKKRQIFLDNISKLDYKICFWVVQKSAPNYGATNYSFGVFLYD